jgi:hypothetical protein
MTLLCYLPYLWYNMVMVIGSIAKKLGLDDIVVALLSKEMR